MSPETTCRHWISTWICNPTHNLATSLRLFVGRLRLIGGHRRSSEICLGCPKWVKNFVSNSTILISKIWTATGVAMPKYFATSRRRPESASDWCKIVRFVSRFCPNYTGFTHRRRIANDLRLSHKLTSRRYRSEHVKTARFIQLTATIIMHAIRVTSRFL